MEDSQRKRQRQPCRDETPRRRNEQPNRRSQARQPCRRTSPIAQARKAVTSESAPQLSGLRPTGWQARFAGKKSGWRRAADWRSPKVCAIVQLEYPAPPPQNANMHNRGVKRANARLGIAFDQGWRRIEHTAAHLPSMALRQGLQSNDADRSNDSGSSIRDDCADPLERTGSAGGAGNRIGTPHIAACRARDQRLGATRRAYWS